MYFDDFKIEHIKSPVISSQDYYPFGLTFNSFNRENSLRNQIKFQGQENQDELDLGWDQFKWRNHQPEIGRFFNVDPLSEKYYYNSPYAFSENKVVAHIELEGLESFPTNMEVGSGSNLTMDKENESTTPKNNTNESKGGAKVVNGVTNMIFGAIGTVGSAAFIAGTDGAGAAFGGGAAFAFSLGEMTLGLTQAIDGMNEMATGNESPQSTELQNASTIIGLAASGSSHAELIDATSGFVPGAITGGNFKTMFNLADNLISAKTTGKQIFEVVNSVDAFMDTANLGAALGNQAKKAMDVKSPVIKSEKTFSEDQLKSIAAFAKTL